MIMYMDSGTGIRRVLNLFPVVQAGYAAPGVPDPIARDLAEAFGCQNGGFLYGAAVVGRRALQAALIDKGATKYKLVDQINEISDELLPKQLKLAAQQVRLIGNDAAHVDEVDADDVGKLLKFVQEIFHILYVMPHEVNEAQAARPLAAKHVPK